MDNSSITVLVTGGAGFIGHHMIRRLLKHPQYCIISLDRLDFSGNLNRLAELANEFSREDMSRLRIIYHDLRAEINPQLAQQIGSVDYVIHMAAGSHVNRSIQDPMSFVMDNVVATCNVLNFVRVYQKGIKKFINFGTDEIFGSAPMDREFSEYDRYNSRSPYSATKAGAEELCVAFENTYNMPIVCTHTMNVFGERQLNEKFIGLALRSILKQDRLRIHSDSKGLVPGLRHWIHAADVADATMFIMHLDQFALPDPDFTCAKFNIVGTREISNLEVAETIAAIVGLPLRYELVSYDKERPGHDFRYALSGQYLRSLGWVPKYDFEHRIRQVIEWTLKNPQWL